SHPVLVYFHGGGWSYGSTCEPIYDGTTFVHNNPDIIVVCVTYRLGLMGQIRLPGNVSETELQYSTNNGLLDQRCALRWIQDNISEFGGDPKNVTICGESAGGGSVSLQCLLGKDDYEKGRYFTLFHNAIAMSGGINQVTTWEDSKMLTQRLMEDCKYDSLQMLLDAPFEELAAWWQNNHILMNYPILDGIVLPKDIDSLYAKFSSPEIKEIPMIQGATTNEFAYYRSAFTDEQFNTICANVDKLVTSRGKVLDDYKKAVVDLYKKMHPSTTRSEEEIVKLELTNDYALQGINYRQLGLIGNTGRTYAYAFDIPYEGDTGLYSLYSKIEAAHGVDCFYLFGNFDGRKCHGSRDAVHFSKNFQRYIADFCKYGKLGDNDIWQPYTVDEKDKKNEKNILLLTQDKDEYHFLRTNDFAARITTYNELVKVNADLLNLKPWSFFLTENHR
ncbi:MAG: carboxylesterase family protein, partial [Bacteroidales bacterium]|nr:carboxylesterase family protein [Bacteroidales bacterium]